MIIFIAFTHALHDLIPIDDHSIHILNNKGSKTHKLTAHAFFGLVVMGLLYNANKYAYPMRMQAAAALPANRLCYAYTFATQRRQLYKPAARIVVG
jgi:hypothetical protein